MMLKEYKVSVYEPDIVHGEDDEFIVYATNKKEAQELALELMANAYPEAPVLEVYHIKKLRKLGYNY